MRAMYSVRQAGGKGQPPPAARARRARGNMGSARAPRPARAARACRTSRAGRHLARRGPLAGSHWQGLRSFVRTRPPRRLRVPRTGRSQIRGAAAAAAAMVCTAAAGSARRHSSCPASCRRLGRVQKADSEAPGPAPRIFFPVLLRCVLTGPERNRRPAARAGWLLRRSALLACLRTRGRGHEGDAKPH